LTNIFLNSNLLQMKAIFKTFSGTPYSYDPISGKVSPDIRTTSNSKWNGGRIFNKMEIPSKLQVDENINQNQKSLQLNVTENCSNRCLYCIYSGSYYFERVHSPKLMNLELGEKAVRTFLEHSKLTDSPNIAFYGGEPLMNGAFQVVEKITNYASSLSNGKSINFSMTSNGRHMTPDHLHFLTKNKVYLRVSLDGPAVIHDRYRRSRQGEPTFEEIMSNLEKIKDYDSDYYDTVGFVCVLSPPLRYKEIKDFFDNNSLVKGHDLTLSFLQLVDQALPFEFDEGQFIKERAIMYKECIKSYFINLSHNDCTSTFENALLSKNLSIIHELQTNKRDINLALNGCCIPGGRKCFIDTGGNIYACEKIGGCYPLGNVEKYIEVESACRMIDDYYKLSYESCYNCWCAQLCDLCFVAARKAGEFDRLRKLDSCQERKDLFKASLRLYASLIESVGQTQLDKLLPKSLGDN
jgi:uncharacterized protein